MLRRILQFWSHSASLGNCHVRLHLHAKPAASLPIWVACHETKTPSLASVLYRTLQLKVKILNLHLADTQN